MPRPGALPVKELVPASVIVATYNDRNILEWSLAAFARQSFRNFELLVADDGSDEDYEPILRKWAPRFAHDIVHVRQERREFRKTRIQNRAAALARTERLVFVDIDCLPQENFVRNHLLFLEPGVALTAGACTSGRRFCRRRKLFINEGSIWAPGSCCGNG
jgi:glycosyltransferase involved in cell wall biosynthesis